MVLVTWLFIVHRISTQLNSLSIIPQWKQDQKAIMGLQHNNKRINPLHNELITIFKKSFIWEVLHIIGSRC